MLKKILILFALCCGVAGSAVNAQNRPISSDLPWDNDAATAVLEDRLPVMFPDGSSAANLHAALENERFHMTSDRRGTSTPTSDGYHFVNKNVLRFRFGCGTTLQVNWQQRDGQVFDIVGRMHEGCM